MPNRGRLISFLLFTIIAAGRFGLLYVYKYMDAVVLQSQVADKDKRINELERELDFCHSYTALHPRGGN